MNRAFWIAFLGSVTLGFVAPAASAGPILPGRCHMGFCNDNQFIRKSVLKSSDRGTLYTVQLAHRSWPMGSEPPAKFDAPSTSYVYCSTEKPAYLFESDGTYYAHLLNPGGEWFGYNYEDYPIYWATCHNFVGPDFFSEEMTQRARDLGYPLNLDQSQITLEHLTDIMD